MGSVTRWCGTVSLTRLDPVKGCLSAKHWILRWPGPEKGGAPGMLKACFFSSLFHCGERRVCHWWYSLIPVIYRGQDAVTCPYSLARQFVHASSICLGVTGAEEFCQAKVLLNKRDCI